VDSVADGSGAAPGRTVPDASPRFVGACFNLPAPADTDSFVLESGLLSSPNSVDFENDYLAGDAAALFPTDLFDISQFLHEDGNGVASDTTVANGQSVAAEAELDLHFADFENHFSSENINLQPHSGASTSGCDDGGIAVGV
jgi:transcriptional activator HAC1